MNHNKNFLIYSISRRLFAKQVGFLGVEPLNRAGKGRGLRGTCNEVSSRENPRFGVGRFFNVKKFALPLI
ncbi:MAG: hypothetical protein IKQ13_06565 [Treponema sp.]|nr:hypothetical protein [Treponema sp.]